MQRAGWARRVLSCWVFVLVIASLGMLTMIPFAHAAVRLRRPSMWLLVAVYAVVGFAMCALIIFIPTESDGDPRAGPAMAWFLLVLVTVAAGIVQLSPLRRQILAGRRGAPATVARIGKGDGAPLLHCAMLSVDVEKSGDESRDSEAFVQFRRVLFEALKDAFESSRIDWASCVRHETGDGMIVIVPPEFHKSG